MAIMNPSLVKYREFYEKFGLTKVDRVSSTVTYRGWAPHGATDSDPKWLIERETAQGTVTISEYADNGDFDQIWSNRASLFSEPPWANTYSLVFDGVNDYVDIGDNFNKDRLDPWTMSFWYRPRIVTSQQTIYSKRAASGIGLELKMLSNGRLDITLMNSGSNYIRVQMTYSLLPQTWYNVVMTYDGSSTAAGVKLYLNTQSQTLSVVANTLTATILTTQVAYLGQLANSNFLDGHLDEVSFWNAVLTAGQVEEIYNSGRPGDLSSHTALASLVHHWRMGDAATFPTVADQIGAVNGTMTNMTEASIVTEIP